MAELQGNSALSGGVGAVSGELASKVIINTLYGGKDANELTEEEKQTISALSQLASGLAVAAGGGNIGDASAAINSSKNAVENNNFGLAIVKAAEATCNGDTACEQQVIKEGIDSYNEMIIEGGTPQVIVLGTLIVAPAAIAAAEAGMAACSVNPVLCANQVAIWVMETIGAEAMPAAGLGMSAAELAKSLSKAQLKELSALMAMEKSGELTPGLAKKLKEFLNKTPETNIVTKGSSAKSAGKGTGVKTNTEQADNVIIKPSTNATETLPTVDQLSQAAASVNRNGLTDAGRALQKHGGREGSVYTYSSQKASVLNKEAQNIVDDILSNPKTIITRTTATENKKIIKVIHATSPDGRTLRFNEDGTKLIGFREPNKK